MPRCVASPVALTMSSAASRTLLYFGVDSVALSSGHHGISRRLRPHCKGRFSEGKYPQGSRSRGPRTFLSAPKDLENDEGVAGRHYLRITSSIEHGIALDATVSASGRRRTPGADSRRIRSTSPLCKRFLARTATPKGAIVPR